MNIIVGVLLAALAYYLCVLLVLPPIVGIVAAILVLLGAVGSTGRWRM